MERFFENEVVKGSLRRHEGGAVAVLSLEMEGRANKINEAFVRGLAAALDATYAVEGLAGIVLTSGHKDFCVGADLDMVYRERDAHRIYAASKAFHQLHRRLEKGGVPVVAALTGSALGGGYELALACHHRVALNDGRVQLGLPEVMLGLIPGGGGTQRLPRLIGLQPALEHVVQGRIVRAPKAKGVLVDDLQPTVEAVVDAAVAWCRANPKAKQPWDDRGFRWPGPRPASADARNLFLAAAAMTYKKTAGAFPAAEAAISAIHEGAAIAFDRALEVEARHFARLVVSDQAKDMIRTLFFHKQAADKQEGLPKSSGEAGFRRVAILGAGMMGAGLAFVCAQAGYEVVLRDITDEAVARGMDHVRQQAGKRLKHLPDAERQAVLDRITPTVALEPIGGCDLVIEAVFEDLDLKHRVTREVEPLLADGAVFASNTSAIPITDLAKASAHPERFIGLHFFSPVEQMPLLEIIMGAATSDETLGRCLAFARRVKKTVIVVNDGYGFYTSRVFSAYIMEGAQLVAEGHDPVLIEWAARAAGMVVPPLQVFDEVSLKLGRHALTQALTYKGEDAADNPAVKLVFAMVDEHGRLGKAHGAGFYDYDNGRRKGFWQGLRDVVGSPVSKSPVEQLSERLVLAQVAEVLRCLDEGILRTHRDAEVGAIFGIGFAPNTGGPLAYVDRRGLPETKAALEALAEAHGDRFRPAPVLADMAARGERFFEAV